MLDSLFSVLFVFAVEKVGGVVVSRGIVAFAEGVHAAFEIREVLAVVGPAHLGDGRQTRQQHVFQMRGREDVFRPEVRLNAEYVGPLQKERSFFFR